MNLQIHEEAGEWVIKHRNGGLDARDRESFDAWLRASPQHVRAYLEMSSVWEDVPSLDSTWNPSADELIARARADDNVVALHSSSPFTDSSLSGRESSDDNPRDSVGNGRAPAARADMRSAGSPRLTAEERPPNNRNLRLVYALAASILITLSGGWLYLQLGVYATDTGEQRSLALADGSTVELNSRSRIKVQYTEHERRIDLLEGQALFHVAKNKARPFIVQTGDTRLRAVGTAFDVYKTSSGTVVTVVEGRVAVYTDQRSQSVANRLLHDRSGGPQVSEAPANTEEGSSSVRTAQRHASGSSSASSQEASGIHAVAGEILLAAGEQLAVTPASVAAPKRANIADATAWTRRRLVFDSSPLAEVAQEFNRYNTRRLVIEDPRLELADFHVSGVFSSVEPTLLLRFLRAQPELVVEETDTEIRITRK